MLWLSGEGVGRGRLLMQDVKIILSVGNRVALHKATLIQTRRDRAAGHEMGGEAADRDAARYHLAAQ